MAAMSQKMRGIVQGTWLRMLRSLLVFLFVSFQHIACFFTFAFLFGVGGGTWKYNLAALSNVFRMLRMV